VEARELATEFLHREAALLDDHDYDAWLSLWSERGSYWVPANGSGGDPTTEVSFIFDDVRRLRKRVQQLQTGYRFAQLPQSRTQRYISNVRIVARREDRLTVRASYLVAEARFGEMTLWPGRIEHELVRTGDDLVIDRKTVVLINNDLPVKSMAFLL
jgi:3-phenylpropionate/cinnamic acid dioxygenase small subunit